MPLRLGEIGGLDIGVAGAVRDSLGPGFEMSTLELDLDGGAEPKIGKSVKQFKLQLKVRKNIQYPIKSWILLAITLRFLIIVLLKLTRHVNTIGVCPVPCCQSCDKFMRANSF